MAEVVAAPVRERTGTYNVHCSIRLNASGARADEQVAGHSANVGCTDWTSQTGIAGGDLSCFGGNGGDAYNQIPAALFRGGNFINLTAAGVFKVRASSHPSATFDDVGFRCAR